MTARTNHNGQFSIAGIIPGDYLVFAVAPNAEQSYYALDFAERNLSLAERATFKSGESKIFVLENRRQRNRRSMPVSRNGSFTPRSNVLLAKIPP